MNHLSPRQRRRVPAWMTSYSDMMTNMLCFFILMVALTTQQDAGLMESGMGSHLERLESLGLPGIKPSTRTLIPKDSPLANYRPPRIDPLEREGWTRHTEKMLVEEFDRLKDAVSDEQDPGEAFAIPLGLKFSPRNDRLTFADREGLERLAPTLRRLEGELEVVGRALPSEHDDPADRLRLSLKRATATARYLAKSGIPPERLIPIGQGSSEARGGEGTRKVTLLWRRKR